MSVSKDLLNNVNIVDEHVLSTPAQLKAELPITAAIQQQVSQARATIADIIHGRDRRLLVICGPCSIHDPAAAIEYGQRLAQLAQRVNDQIYLVMRVYFEKPRTTVGWKGLINDPHLDESFDIETGLTIARKLLLTLSELGLPLATEALDPNNPQYLGDLFSWAAIGARTTESQTHREMASGLSVPVGFKNGTDGSLATAMNALQAAARGHHFVGINQQGQVAVLQTAGNPNGHIILRGGHQPNYQAEAVAQCQQQLAAKGLASQLMIDCSHGNSNKDYRRQPLVAQAVMSQIEQGNQSIIGIMLESHLHEGNQSAEGGKEQWRYGVSITDACIDWSTTETLMMELHQRLAKRAVR